MGCQSSSPILPHLGACECDSFVTSLAMTESGLLREGALIERERVPPYLLDVGPASGDGRLLHECGEGAPVEQVVKDGVVSP